MDKGQNEAHYGPFMIGRKIWLKISSGTFTHLLTFLPMLPPIPLPPNPNTHSALFCFPNFVPFIPFFHLPPRLCTLQTHFSSSSEFHLFFYK